MLSAVPANRPAGGLRRRPVAGRGPVRRRRTAAAGLAVLLAMAGSGCAKFNQSLGQQEEVVIFQSNTPQAVKLKIRAACSHLPGTTTEPLPTDGKASDELYDVRYQVGNASTAELARLQQCLSRFSAVSGLETNTPGGD